MDTVPIQIKINQTNQSERGKLKTSGQTGGPAIPFDQILMVNNLLALKHTANQEDQSVKTEGQPAGNSEKNLKEAGLGTPLDEWKSQTGDFQQVNPLLAWVPAFNQTQPFEVASDMKADSTLENVEQGADIGQFSGFSLFLHNAAENNQVFPVTEIQVDENTIADLGPDKTLLKMAPDVNKSNESIMGRNSTSNIIDSLPESSANESTEINLVKIPISTTIQSLPELAAYVNEWMNKDARPSIDAVNPSRADFSFHLQNMGQVNMEVSALHGELSVKLIADNSMVNEIVENQFQLLERTFQQYGFKVKNIEVMNQPASIMDQNTVSQPVTQNANQLMDGQMSLKPLYKDNFQQYGAKVKNMESMSQSVSVVNRIADSQPAVQNESQLMDGQMSLKPLYEDNFQQYGAKVKNMESASQPVSIVEQISVSQPVTQNASPLTDRQISFNRIDNLIGNAADPPFSAETMDVSQLNEPAIPLTYQSQQTEALNQTKSIQPTPVLTLPEFVHEVSNWITRNVGMSQAQDGTKGIKFLLSPEHLGQIEVSITSQDGQVSAQIVTDTLQAKEILDGQLHQLKQTLQHQGLLVQKLEIVQQTPAVMDSSLTNPSFSQGGFQSPQEQRSAPITKNSVKKQKESDQPEVEMSSPFITYGGTGSRTASNIDFTA
ncbi:flagellar hook-length control protein FliK [Neobacillus mesonae]|uniref:flagellar hook-length control protein FliK n=1 Tax=Neobacillus mesonae TaxID=1193713 RepID=UPI002041C9E2|nr:flagellar hook-length control protein FliK [Neobacillus mesonae]MCM3566982.1 flagellar hook-length control protein FliK [Neobacillus mesonae]